VAIPSSHVLAPAEFLDYDLLGLELIDDLADHSGALQGGSAQFGAAVDASDQQDLGENQFVTSFTVPSVNSDSVAFANADLMASILNDCIHLWGSVTGQAIRPSYLFGGMAMAGPAPQPERGLNSSVLVLDLYPSRKEPF
jgi:hypothetical protein